MLFLQPPLNRDFRGYAQQNRQVFRDDHRPDCELRWGSPAGGDRGGQDPPGAGQADSVARARGEEHGLQDGGHLPHQETVQGLLQQEHSHPITHKTRQSAGFAFLIAANFVLPYYLNSNKRNPITKNITLRYLAIIIVL